jgi:IclR family transcriptional regulator, blcABC operon repressor
MHATVADLPSPTKPALVPAVARALALLDLLEKERGAMSLAKLAASLSLPKSSVHGLCNTLTALGYLRRQDDGAFYIGPRVMGLANAFAEQTTPAQELDRLWNSLGTVPQETLILSVLDGTDVVYVAVRNGMRPLGMAFSVGMRLPAHRAATGRAMLAFHDEAWVKRLYPGARLPAFMNMPTMRRTDLLEELARTRERGHSIDDEDVRRGVYCMAAPVFGASGEVVAGLGICLQKAGLKARFVAQQRDTVIELAHSLSERLGATSEQRSK